MGKVALGLWNQLDLSDSLFDLGLEGEERLPQFFLAVRLFPDVDEAI